jgi:hypothetical protein
LKFIYFRKPELTFLCAAGRFCAAGATVAARSLLRGWCNRCCAAVAARLVQPLLRGRCCAAGAALGKHQYISSPLTYALTSFYALNPGAVLISHIGSYKVTIARMLLMLLIVVTDS